MFCGLGEVSLGVDGNVILHQVMGDYSGELELEHVTQNAPAVKKLKTDWVGRAVSFMGRGLTAGVGPVGRVAKRKRVKSMHWGVCLDNCLLFATGRGIDAFEITKSVRERNPYEWPCLQVVPDQGPDGMCASNGFMYGWQQRIFNLWVAWDKSHGAHNDVKLACKAAGLWAHQLLAAVAAAAPFSPWNTGARREQVREAMAEYFTHMDHNCPLFQECLPLLLKERGDGHRITESGIGLEVWNDLKCDPIWDESGIKLSLYRFQSVVSHVRKDV